MDYGLHFSPPFFSFAKWDVKRFLWLFLWAQAKRSPFPFSLYAVANAFSALMLIAEEKGIINSFEACGDGPLVTHLQFANDTICFFNADIEQVENLDVILKIYECISGLKVSKSCMVGVGVNGDMLSIHTNSIG